ncbi:MAG: hypothetical protein AABY22_22855 [Nanoarchaeota archaeon]
MIKQKTVTRDSDEIQQMLFVQKLFIKILGKHKIDRDVAINSVMQLISSMFANEANSTEELKQILLRCTKIISNEAFYLFKMISELKENE